MSPGSQPFDDEPCRELKILDRGDNGRAQRARLAG
jgi:hypothetical protein